MIFEGTYKVKYTLDGKLTELEVKVDLREREGLLNPGQSIYYGVTTVNGSPYGGEIDGCVNAQYCAEGIGIKLLDEYKAKAKADGKSFRIKRK